MVCEINYEQYKEFCSKLSCKDAFYFLKNLFVKFPNDTTIYAVKSEIDKDPEQIFQQLEEKGLINHCNLEDFISGLPDETLTYLKEDMYKDKSFLVEV